MISARARGRCAGCAGEPLPGTGHQRLDRHSDPACNVGAGELVTGLVDAKFSQRVRVGHSEKGFPLGFFLLDLPFPRDPT